MFIHPDDLLLKIKRYTYTCIYAHICQMYICNCLVAGLTENWRCETHKYMRYITFAVHTVHIT